MVGGAHALPRVVGDEVYEICAAAWGGIFFAERGKTGTDSATPAINTQCTR